MTSYVALLRGINVGGNRRIGMKELRDLVSGLGHTEVSTYLQSGNVLLASEEVPGTISAGLTEALAGIGDVDVLLRTRAELAAIIAANPYLGRQDDFTKLHVTFLAAPVKKGAEVPVPSNETGELTVGEREVFLHVPDGYGRTKLNNAYLERKLGVRATTRNWKSVVALHDLLHSHRSSDAGG